MKRFLQFVIRNPVAVILALAMMGVAGVFAMLHLPTGLFPGLDIPVVNVICHQPGAAAEDMELMVSRPIEDRLRTIPGIRRVSSTSLEGICQITAEFDWGIRLGDARQFVQGEISAVQGQLPAGVEPRLENIGTTLQEVAGYVVTGGDPVALRAIVQTDFSSRLMNAEGVSRVEILGGDDPAYIVRLRSEALARLHLSPGDVVAALKSHNLSMATDFIERGGREYLIRGDSLLQSLEQVRMVPLVSGGNGRAVFLGDIATVRRGRVPKHYRIHGNGVPAVAFLVSKQPAWRGAWTANWNHSPNFCRRGRRSESSTISRRSSLPPGTRSFGICWSARFWRSSCCISSWAVCDRPLSWRPRFPWRFWRPWRSCCGSAKASTS